MRKRKGNFIVELVGCQYSRDDMPSPTPLVFFVLKKKFKYIFGPNKIGNF